jgi:hypothetical protein
MVAVREAVPAAIAGHTVAHSQLRGRYEVRARRADGTRVLVARPCGNVARSFGRTSPTVANGQSL